MSVKNFWKYFEEAKAKLSSFSFTEDKLYTMASELALRLVEVDLKERESVLSREKLTAEMEALVLQNKLSKKQNEIEILKSLVQAESMVRSVGDNAAINRANAYVGFLNVVGNASESAAIATHANNVLNEIKKISSEALSASYSEILRRLKDNLLNSANKGGKMRECFMMFSHADLKVGEVLEIEAFTIYPSNECRFEYGGKSLLNSKTLSFSSEAAGEFPVIFKVKDDNGTWIEDKIVLKVS